MTTNNAYHYLLISISILFSEEYVQHCSVVYDTECITAVKKCKISVDGVEAEDKEEPENWVKREIYQEYFNQVGKASSRQHKVVILWWKAWLSQSFRNLVPRSKWIQVHSNVAKAIICHIIYMNRVSSL